MVKLCFIAIFKNESKNVYRCLDRLKGVADCISICDTGSTDKTVELIQQWGKDNNIPTKTHFEPFTNFGHNRSVSFEMAQKSFPEADYALLLDADMVLMYNNFDKNKLTKDQYRIIQKNDTIRYYNTRLIKMSLPWKCIGVTHEYWECSAPHVTEKTDMLWIDDKEDGGCKDDKFERDKRLLLAGIDDEKEKPDVKVRYMFYLAQTLQNLKEYNAAVGWYTKRIESGGWDEEIYYSQLQIGASYENMKEYQKAAGAYLEAWQKRPVRSESLYQLSRMYRLQAKNQLGLLFAIQGLKIPYPKDDLLFIDYRVYQYLLLEEVSINAFYVPDMKEEGIKAIHKLLSMKDSIPKSNYELALSNSKFYNIVVIDNNNEGKIEIRNESKNEVKIQKTIEIPIQQIKIVNSETRNESKSKDNQRKVDNKDRQRSNSKIPSEHKNRVEEVDDEKPDFDNKPKNQKESRDPRKDKTAEKK